MKKDKYLFGGTPVGLNCCSAVTGFNAGPGSGSKYASGSNSSGIVSGAACVLDALFFFHNIYVWSGAGLIMAEIGPDIVATDGKKARTCGTVTPEHIIFADIFYELEYGDNDEMLSLINTFANTQPGKVFRVTDVARFCDSYYQHRVKKAYSIIIDETLTMEEVEAAVRSSGIKKAAFLKKVKDLPETRFKNLPKNPSSKQNKKKESPVYIPQRGGFLEACRRGDYIVQYPWSEEQRKFIPPLSFLDNMVENDAFRKFVTKIHYRTDKILKRMQEADDKLLPEDRIKLIGSDSINVSFVGKPGTGKSFNVHAAASACGLPLYVVNLSQNTDEDRIEGMTKIIDGKPASVPTEVIKGYKDGGIVLFEEVNLSQPAVIMGAFGQAVEFPYVLKEYGYRDVHRHPLCIVVSTMNIGTAGTKTVAQQFANRFRQSYYMDDPEKEQFIERLVRATGESKRTCSWVYLCYERITRCIREEATQADPDSILAALSVRTCIGAIENIQEGSPPKEAVIDSIIGKVREQDWEVAVLCESVLKTIRDEI